MNRNIDDKILRSAFDKYSETVWVHTRGGLTKGEAYDPYRNTGHTKSLKNPLPVKAIVRQIQANSLIIRELGLTVSGAIEITVQDADIDLIKLAEKIKYNENEYSLYHDGLGRRVQIYNRYFGFSKVVLFRVGN